MARQTIQHRKLFCVLILILLLTPVSGWSFGLGSISVPTINLPDIPKLPKLPALPTLPGLGPLEKPTGDLAVAAIHLQGQADQFIHGLVPSINVPGVGKVSSLESFQDGIIEDGMQVLDHTLGQLANMTGLPIPQRSSLAPGAGTGFAMALWKSKRLKATCVLAGKSCGPLMTRLAQAAVENDPTRGRFCQVMIGVADNRVGFGRGFNQTMTRNIRSLVPDTSVVSVDFKRPHCR